MQEHEILKKQCN